MLIDVNKPLVESYSSLLLRWRAICVSIQDKTAICVNCDRSLSNHLPDGRCNVSCTSFKFHGKESDEKLLIEKALSLIEDLKLL